MNIKTDAELSRIYRSAYEAHPARETDSALALDSAGETLREHLVEGQTGSLDQEALTWTSDPRQALAMKRRRVESLLRSRGFAEGDRGDWLRGSTLVRLDIAHAPGMAWLDRPGMPREELTYDQVIERFA